MFNRQNNGCGCGCGCGRRGNTRTAPVTNCEPITYVVQPDCMMSAVDMTLLPSQPCATACEFVTYTLTITNNCSEELQNPILNCDIGDSLCYTWGTLTVDGTIKEDVRCLRNLGLDNIPAGQTVTITYQVRVMEPKRYIVTHCDLSYQISCCCQNKCLRTISNGAILQVCTCCCGGQSANVSSSR